MKHFTWIRGQVENAGSSENLALPRFAGFPDLLFRVPWLLSIGQFNVKKVFCER
jgi:hypothetical protein